MKLKVRRIRGVQKRAHQGLRLLATIRAAQPQITMMQVGEWGRECSNDFNDSKITHFLNLHLFISQGHVEARVGDCTAVANLRVALMR